MNKDEILVPILTAINNLREEVRENIRAIQKNSEKYSYEQVTNIQYMENKRRIEKLEGKLAMISA